jgi:ketosteroid isomerase-like protein
MRACFYLLLFVCVQACECPGDRPDELVAQEREWSRAVIAGDRAATARLLADEFAGIDGRGTLSTKQEELAEAQGEASWKVLAEQLDEFVVRFYGTTAIVTARNRETVSADGRELVVVFRRTTVWVRRAGRWQCVAFHASRIGA